MLTRVKYINNVFEGQRNINWSPSERKKLSPKMPKKKSAKSKSIKSAATASGKSAASKRNSQVNDPTPPPPQPQKETQRIKKPPAIDEPNPGFYALPSTVGYIDHDPTIKCQPAFTIATVREPKSPKNDSENPATDSVPGPKYNFWDVTRFGAIPMTGAILTSRNPPPTAKDVGPGPGKYAPEQYECPGIRKAPEPRILGRTEPKNKGYLTPSPGQYMVPDTMGENHPIYTSSPSATINGRSWDKQKPGEKDDSSPGPNQYFNYELETFYRSSPSARMLGRVKAKDTVGPGPGKYNADYTQGAEGPAFSFGVRHSRKAGVLRDD